MGLLLAMLIEFCAARVDCFAFVVVNGVERSAVLTWAVSVASVEHMEFETTLFVCLC